MSDEARCGRGLPLGLQPDLWTTVREHSATGAGAVGLWTTGAGEPGCCLGSSDMGERTEVGVSTGEASRAAVSAVTIADQYEVIDLSFRAVIADVADAVVEPVVAEGVSAFCDTHVDELVRLRAHMLGISQGADEASRAAAETDRGNAERFADRAV